MKESKSNKNLDEREYAILRALVYEHISTGKPVGSRSFVKKYSFSISPATMRNVMYDLEKMGYLMQPHTSAGRIPTDMGYRFYVDSLLDTYDYVSAQKSKIREDLFRREVQLDKIFSIVTKILSTMSNYAGVVLTPKMNFAVVKNIELISLHNDEVLLVLVTRTGMIFNKRVSISARITQDELYKLSNFLSGELCGYSLAEIKDDIFEQLRNSIIHDFKKEMALDIAQLALSEDSDPELFIDGIENLLRIPEVIEKEKLNQFLRLIEGKKILKEVIEKNLEKEGIHTLIGKEIYGSDIKVCSMVTTPYKIGTKNVGVVGVLGPMRMDYEKVVPLVDYTGRVLTDLLTGMSK